MREIKFRGKKKNGSWLFGDLVQRPPIALIFPLDAPDSQDNYIVDLKTVGQFTGLTDKNGVEIYEHDIIKFLIDNEKYVVQFEEGAFCLVSNNVCGIISMYDFENLEYEVIGNIHENPELL